MAKATRVRRCFNCGAILQTTNSKEEGFISRKIIEENKPDALLYCNRCYNKVKALNFSQLEEDVDDEIDKILRDAVATDAVIIWVVDLFSFNGTLNEAVIKRIKNLKVIVVGTKRDLFEKRIKDSTFVRFLDERFTEAGVKPFAIRIFGHESDFDAPALLKSLDGVRQGHDIYMIGTSLSGKTAIINHVLKGFQNKSKWSVRTLVYPGTDVNVLEIPLSNSSFFYELPGFSLATSLISKVNKDVLKTITPKKKIETSQRLVDKNEALVVGNVAVFELVSGKNTAFKFYSSEAVETKKVKCKYLKEFQITNLRTKQVRPVVDDFTNFGDFDMFEYDMENDNKIHDIAISGLGWISFIAKGQKIRVTLPKGVALKESLGKIR